MHSVGTLRSPDRIPLELGPVGLGAAPIGNLFTQVSDADASATLAAAYGHGIRWFDVAPFYGYGLAEVRLGRYLREAKVANAILSTKVGRVLKHATSGTGPPHFVAPLPFRPVFDYSRVGVERSYDESLKRLGLDRVQLLLLHDIDRLTHAAGHRAVARQVLDEALPTLHRLKAEKRVDAIGLGINEWEVGYEVLASAQIDCVLLAGRYTLLDQTSLTSGFLDACTRRGVAVLAGGVFNSGFLAGGNHYAYLQATPELLERRAALARACDRHKVALAAAALQFTAAHPAITSIVVGARAAAEVEAILGWRNAQIPQNLWQDLRSQGLIPLDAPVPE
jgi:D-threo-aldose 1-dehydrogenase